MSLAGLRIGSVPYLNARPLHFGIEDQVHMAPPVDLARDLHEGRLDAALVPVIEALQHPVYDLVDGIAIASDGPVHSVVLCHAKPLELVQSIALDGASKTSTQLVRIVLTEFLKLSPAFVSEGTAADGQLWIGDQAIAYRREHRNMSCLDLGAAWTKHTGLPFIYAVWALRRGKNNSETAAWLRRIAEAGLSARRAIARSNDEYRYLTENIRYQIGPREKAGLARFAELLASNGTVPDNPVLTWI